VTDFKKTKWTWEAIQTLVKLGFPKDEFPRLHHLGKGLVDHYNHARHTVSTGRFRTGRNIPTGERLHHLGCRAEQLAQSVTGLPQEEADEALFGAVDLEPPNGPRLVLSWAAWDGLIAGVLNDYPIDPDGPPAANPDDLGPGRRPLAEEDQRHGFYVVTLRDWQPMLSWEHRDSTIQVCRGWVKVGRARGFGTRRGNYSNTFGPENAVFRPFAAVTPEALDNADALVRRALAAWRRRNPATGSLTEWMTGISRRKAVEVALEALTDLAVDVLWSPGADEPRCAACLRLECPSCSRP